MDTKKNNIYKKNLSYYLALPWTYTIETEADKKGRPIFVVHVNELPGVSTDATSIETAMKSIKEAMKLAFKMYLEAGDEIPEPIDEAKYQGNISYRTSPRRHYLIAQEAEKQGSSLSKIIDNFVDTAAKISRK